MLSKIFLFVLLLTCVYTYMLKSIKDNNDINFQKSPNNFNFELNEIQTVKPNLKEQNMIATYIYLKMVFSDGFVRKVER